MRNTILTKPAIMLKVTNKTFWLPMGSIFEIAANPDENMPKYRE